MKPQNIERGMDAKGMIDNELRNMRGMIDALLSGECDQRGIDVTPMFRMAKANMIENVSNDLRLAVILGKAQDIEYFAGELDKIIDMQL